MTPATPAPAPLDTAYQAWKADPTPDNLYATVQHLQPVMRQALSAIGSADDPFLRAKADVVAAEAVKSWSPDAGASLSSWTHNQMQRLARMRREHVGPVKVPDRTWQEQVMLTNVTNEFIDKHGRDPDLEELADAARMPVSRIRTIRRSVRMAPESAFGDVPLPGMPAQDPLLDEALDYLYRDSGKEDRKLLELQAGVGGDPPLSSVEVAQRLGVHPSQVTRRSRRLAMRLHELHHQLMAAYGNEVAA